MPGPLPSPTSFSPIDIDFYPDMIGSVGHKFTPSCAHCCKRFFKIIKTCKGHEYRIKKRLAAGATECRSEKGWSLLHAAAQVGDNELLELGLNQGFEIDEKDNDGRTPLLIASLYGNVSSYRFLVENGADKDAVDSDGNNTDDLQKIFFIAEDLQEIFHNKKRRYNNKKNGRRGRARK